MATTANHVLLRRITLSASAASVTFDSIPQTGYTDLKIEVSARDATASEWGSGKITFNASTAGYTGRNVYGAYGSAGSDTYSFSGAGIYFPVQGNNTTANTFNNCSVYIPNYASANYKSASIDSVTENNSATAVTHLNAALWSNIAAITQITLAPGTTNFVAGSSFSLYGIANAATTPKLAPKADGGDIIKTDGTYWYHAFLASGSFKPQVNLTADVLVVAGGGGGGYERGGGGGAGGLLGFTSQSLASTSTYACTVGAGGSGATGYGTGMTNGGDSQLGSLTLVKGGGYGGSGAGASVPLRDGAAGGSSGGSGYYSTARTAPSVSGQGYAGGAYAGSSPNIAGGGGGGATAVGSDGNPSTGGAGSSAYSSWGAATGTGHNVSSTYYFAGGGGGGREYANSTGGNGGGGSSNYTVPGYAGTPNTGGGGGAGGFGNGQYAGGNGGSGIIIIRYPVA